MSVEYSPRYRCLPVPATILGNRKAILIISAPFILQAQSRNHPQSDCDYEPALVSSSSRKIPTSAHNRQWRIACQYPRAQVIQMCTHEGCTKGYTKPSRLEEHERSQHLQSSSTTLFIFQFPNNQLILFTASFHICETCNKVIFA